MAAGRRRSTLFVEGLGQHSIRVRLSRNTLTDSELNHKKIEFSVDKVSGPASSACLRLHLPAARVRLDNALVTADPLHNKEPTRSFISSVSPDQAERLGRAVRAHWSVENKNHHKRDHHVWQEDRHRHRHRHRRGNIARNLALTRNALLAIIPFDEDKNLPSLIVDYQDRKQLAVDLILKATPFP